MQIYKPGHILFLFVFIVFSVVLARVLLLGTPLSKVPGARTIGTAL